MQDSQVYSFNRSESPVPTMSCLNPERLARVAFCLTTFKTAGILAHLDHLNIDVPTTANIRDTREERWGQVLIIPYRVFEDREEQAAIPVIKEDILTFVPAGGDVEEGTEIFSVERMCHKGEYAIE